MGKKIDRVIIVDKLNKGLTKTEVANQLKISRTCLDAKLKRLGIRRYWK